MMDDFDVVVAGAGIWGCTVARRLAESGKRVLVLEKRPVVGGNVRCEIDPETGIEIHKYGSHIFHTHIPEVWEFVNRFTKFNGYQHKVLAKTKKIGVENRGAEDEFHLYHLPLGLTLINKFFGIELTPSEVQPFLAGSYTPSNFKHQSANLDRRQVIFDAFFRGYTSKQWGKAPEEIDPSIIKRVPVRSNYDTNYFNDYWQGIPTEGYNKLFERMLDHPNIHVETEVTVRMVGDALRASRNPDSTQPSFEIDFGNGRACSPSASSSNPTIQQSNNQTIYYSGPIDALFNYKFGALPWRTLRFERETLPVADYQGASVVNYTDADIPFTRIHEFKHYHPERVEVKVKGEGEQRKLASKWGFDAPKTIIMREYSATWQPGDEPYYPIDNADSRALLAKYQSEVERFNQTIQQSNNQTILHVGGRLGQYKYFDMDKSIASALEETI